MHNSIWQTFLETQGARIAEGVIQDFGNASAERIATRDATVICDLSQFGVLKVSGEDAQTFLQNLCSNDIKAITPNLAQLNSLNTAKGRVLATFLVWQSGTDYFLQLPHSLLTSMHKKLSMYVLRAKVKIEEASSQLICLGISGLQAEDILKLSIGLAPQKDLAAEYNATTCVIRITQNRYQIMTSPEEAVALWQKLLGPSSPVGSPCWDWLNVRSGIPVILPATQEQFVLQMLNLEILGGVSFKKGCYPGQEIVARMHYLGKVKQRTFLAHLDSDLAPQPNDSLYSDDFTGQSSGNILNATPAPQGGYDVLATLHTSSVNSAQTIHWKTPDGAALNIQALPYSFPAEKSTKA
jgi:folate-binding protein YgfZ